MTKRVALAGGATIAAILLAGAPANAADTLSWSFASSSLQSCPFNVDCSAHPALLNHLDNDFHYGPNFNASSLITPAQYAAITPHDYGTLFSAANPGAGGLIALPELHAYASGAIVQDDHALSLNFATAQGVQAFRWDGAAPIDIPIDAFVGTVDCSRTGGPVGSGAFVAAGLALIGPELIGDDDLGRAWFQYGQTAGHFGQFTATCATGGAIALANPLDVAVAPGSGSISVTPTSCLPGGDATYTLNPGETIVLWARLSTFQGGSGVMDAANTFSVGFSPDLPDELRNELVENLVQVPASIPAPPSGGIPEPGAWDLLLTGFLGAGAILRRRRPEPAPTR